MKIGILTYHHVINDGAVLQTIGHVKTLQELYPDSVVEVIDYRYKTVERVAVRTVVKSFLKFRKESFALLAKYFKFKRFVKENLPLSKERIVSDDLQEAIRFINKQQYDYVLVGSDEVWKIQQKKFARKFPNIYWLPPQLNAVRIGSAVSANSSDEKLMQSEVTRAAVSKIIQGFKAIGARDVFTRNYIESFHPEVPVYDVPDPTFGTTITTAGIKEKLVSLGVDFSRKRFLLNMTTNHPEFYKASQQISVYAKQQNIQLVGVGQFNVFCELNLTKALNPVEWASCYPFFDFCITDRFHSTIFSIKGIIPFLVLEYTSKYKGAHQGKIVDLLTKINKMNHHVFCADDLNYISLIEGIASHYNREEFEVLVQTLQAQFRQHLKDNIVPL